MSSTVPGVVWLEVQVIYLQNTRYWLTSAECEAYIIDLYCVYIKLHTSYLWCGAGLRNPSLSIKPCSSYLSQCARLRLEFGSLLSIKLRSSCLLLLVRLGLGQGSSNLGPYAACTPLSFLCSPQRRQDRDNWVHNLLHHIRSFDNNLQVWELQLQRGDLTISQACQNAWHRHCDLSFSSSWSKDWSR